MKQKYLLLFSYLVSNLLWATPVWHPVDKDSLASKKKDTSQAIGFPNQAAPDHKLFERWQSDTPAAQSPRYAKSPDFEL